MQSHQQFNIGDTVHFNSEPDDNDLMLDQQYQEYQQQPFNNDNYSNNFNHNNKNNNHYQNINQYTNPIQCINKTHYSDDNSSSDESKFNTHKMNNMNAIQPNNNIPFGNQHKHINEENEPNQQGHGWIELYTDDGRKYYQNEITKETQWERPPIMDLDLQKLNILGRNQKSKPNHTQSPKFNNINENNAFSTQNNNQSIENNDKYINDMNNIQQYEQKTEPKMEQKHEENNGIRPEILSLSEILRTNCFEKPYWWDNNNAKDIVISWDMNKPISNEIIAKFYTDLNTGADDDINDIEIYSVQNLKLWKQYQAYRNNSHHKMNEHYVWYGTCVTRDVNDICNLGFEKNLMSIVFAKTCEYHYKLCKLQKLDRKSNFQYLFLCRIICDYESYGNTIDATNKNQIYPQFLIRFKRIAQNHFSVQNERKQQENNVNPPQQLYVPEMKQAQSMQINNQSELHLLQQEIPDASFAQSNPFPMNKAKKIEYHKTWTCDLCTFAENRIADAMCAMCDTPQPGQIKCNYCTSMNDKDAKICAVCSKTISTDNYNSNINQEPLTYHDNDDNQNNDNVANDVMDPMVLKYMAEEFEYRSQLNKQENPKPKPIFQQENIADMNLLDDPNDIVDMDLVDDLSDNDDVDLESVNNLQNIYNHSNLVDNPYGNNNALVDNPYVNHNDFVDAPYDDNNQHYNIEDIKREQQYLRDLEFARKLQQEENNNLGFSFDKFIRQHTNQLEAKEEHKADVKLLPPKRKTKPVHGPDKIMTLYHVTSNDAGKKIKESNKMIRGSKGMFGAGIYFAESPKSAHYKAEHGKNNGTLVTCKVYVGKELRVEDANGGQFTFTSLYGEGYDSVWAPNGSGKGKCERVVYNWDQVVIVSVEDYDTAVKRIKKY